MLFLISVVLLWIPSLADGADSVLCPSSGPHLLVTVHMEGEGFMCPFLTPLFLDILETRSHWVKSRPRESCVQYAQPLEEAWSQNGIRGVLESIGYPEDGAVFLQWDTVSVVPEMPVP